LRTTVYQTVKDKDNAHLIEELGPIAAKKYKWLGDGFYFWDTHIELAHWWGKDYSNGYYILEAECIIDEKCWDIHGNGSHRLEFIKSCIALIDSKVTTKEKLTVPQVIEYFKSQGKFKYEGIRAHSPNAIKRFQNEQFIWQVVYKAGEMQYMDLYPSVQICFQTKRALSLRNYTLIYPTDIFG
jgi:hypothetical protein